MLCRKWWSNRTPSSPTARGHVWWRYNTSWPDGRSGEVTSTTGTSTAVIVDGHIVEFEAWLDLGFMLSETEVD